MNRLRYCLSAWDRFLFEPLAPVMCSVIRIAYAALVLLIASNWIVDADIWFTENGVLRAETARQLRSGGYWSVFFWLPPDSRIVSIGLALLFSQALLMLCGCWSRLQVACIFIWLTSFHNRNPLICDGEDTVFRLFAFFMIFMPLDHAWSLRPGNQRPSASMGSESAWALRLMQFEITAIYLSTAWCKWQGATWRDGTALYYVSRMEDVFGRFGLPDFLFETSWIVKACTWGVLGLETLLPLLLWYRPTRRLGVILGIALHLAIEFAMHLYLFEWIMIVGLLSFVQPSDWITRRKPTGDESGMMESPSLLLPTLPLN